MTSFDQSKTAQSFLIPLSLRLADLKDWLARHPITETWWIRGNISSTDAVDVCLYLETQSYKEANAWAWLHCQFADSKHGYDHLIRGEKNLHIPMNDFWIQVSFPPETHPDRLNPELASIKP